MWPRTAPDVGWLRHGLSNQGTSRITAAPVDSFLRVTREGMGIGLPVSLSQRTVDFCCGRPGMVCCCDGNSPWSHALFYHRRVSKSDRDGSAPSASTMV